MVFVKNNDYEEEYYELKAIREDGKAVSEKVEDEDDTEEQTENKKDDGSSEVEEDASDEVEEERDTRKSVKRKGGFLGLFKRENRFRKKRKNMFLRLLLLK